METEKIVGAGLSTGNPYPDVTSCCCHPLFSHIHFSKKAEQESNFKAAKNKPRVYEWRELKLALQQNEGSPLKTRPSLNRVNQIRSTTLFILEHLVPFGPTPIRLEKLHIISLAAYCGGFPHISNSHGSLGTSVRGINHIQ